MPKKRTHAEEIIHKLRGADVLLGQGKTVSQACKQIGVSDQAYSSPLRSLWIAAAASLPAPAAKMTVAAPVTASPPA
jgi:hypothetical protein